MTKNSVIAPFEINNMDAMGIGIEKQAMNTVPGRAARPGKPRRINYVVVYRTYYEKPTMQTQEIFSDEQLKLFIQNINGSSNVSSIQVYKVFGKLNLKISVQLEPETIK